MPKSSPVGMDLELRQVIASLVPLVLRNKPKLSLLLQYIRFELINGLYGVLGTKMGVMRTLQTDRTTVHTYLTNPPKSLLMALNQRTINDGK